MRNRRNEVIEAKWCAGLVDMDCQIFNRAGQEVALETGRDGHEFLLSGSSDRQEGLGRGLGRTGHNWRRREERAAGV